MNEDTNEEILKQLRKQNRLNGVAIAILIVFICVNNGATELRICGINCIVKNLLRNWQRDRQSGDGVEGIGVGG